MWFRPEREDKIKGTCTVIQGCDSLKSTDDCLSSAWVFKNGTRIVNTSNNHKATMLSPSSDGTQILVFDEKNRLQYYWANPKDWIEMKAKAVDGVLILNVEKLPDTVSVLIVSCNDFDEYKRLPRVVEFESNRFGKTGWNSDKCIACYRDDAMVATTLRN